MSDWNAKTIEEFRANEGRVGGTFEGAPLVLLHHRGRKTGREYVTPVMYLPHETEPDIIYVFATKGGAPTNPDWYHNLTAAGDGSLERGPATYTMTVCGRLLPRGGKLSDPFGRQRTLSIGLGGFALASAVGGAAQSFLMLAAARGVRGAFGALMAPAILSLVSTTFTVPAERNKAFGI